MKKHIWQNENWLEIPEIDKEDENILNKLDCLDKKISEFKNLDFFYDIKKDKFVREVFYNWYIEGIELAISTRDKDKIENIFQGKDNCRIGYIYNFMQSKDVITPDDLIRLHDRIIKDSGRGLRKEFSGVGLSENKLVYIAPPPEKLPYLLERFCEILEKTTISKYYLAAFSHIVFVLIHPFQDGNGRVTRILESKILNNYNFTDKSRHIYMSGKYYYKMLSSVRDSLKECIKYILCIYMNAYDNLYKECYNFDYYLKTHKEKYVLLDDIQHGINIDFEHEKNYYIVD